MAHREPLKITDARLRIARVESEAGLDTLQSAVCEPTRLRIMAALDDGAELSVGELAAAIERQVPATSQHLRILRDLGLVTGERLGTTVYYRLKPGQPAEQLRAVLAALHDHHVAS